MHAQHTSPTPSSSSLPPSSSSSREKPRQGAAVQAAPVKQIDVVVRWAGTAIAVERLAEGESFSIGAGGAGDRHFVCDHVSLPTSKFTLVEHAPDGTRLRCARDMRLTIDGTAVNAAEISIAPSQSARLALGPLTFDIRSSRRHRRAIDRLRDRLDGRWLRASGVALSLQLGLVCALVLTNITTTDVPPLPTGMRPLVTITRVIKPPTPTVEQPAAPAAKKIVRAASPTKQKKPVDARQAAQAALNDLFGGARSSVLNDDGGLPSLIAGSLKDLRSTTSASLGGSDGVGARQVGDGGGRTGIGIGQLGSGTGHGTPGHGPPDGPALLPRKRAALIEGGGTVRVEDGLTQDEIQRVINRVMSQLKFCYEKELNATPDLTGKVTLVWRIGPDGRVTDAAPRHTFAAKRPGDEVAGCVARVVGRQLFPKPRGGGEVWVTYPFLMNLAG